MKLKYDEIYKFNSTAIKSFSPETNEIADFREIVYHYTSPSAFLSIINENRIRFTDIRYMNDRSECVFFIKLLLEFIENNKGKYPFAEDIINQLLKQNDYDAIKQLQVNCIQYTEFLNMPYKQPRVFIFCACKKPDLLNMWNYYVNNNKYEGYSIGFRIDELLRTFDTDSDKIIDPFEIKYGDILYDEKCQQTEIKRLIEQIESRFHSSFEMRTDFMSIKLRDYIETYGIFFKHKSFKNESEFRVAIRISEERLHKAKSAWQGHHNKNMFEDFCIKNGLIVPYLSIELPINTITRIYVSPMTEYEIAKSSIKELLEVKGHNGIQIWKSEIPIRF